MTTNPLPPVSQATHRFLDKQDALLSVNNTLKGLLVLSLLVIGFQGWNNSRLAKLLGSREPLVVRQDSVGFAEAVTVNNMHSKIDEQSTKYFLLALGGKQPGTQARHSGRAVFKLATFLYPEISSIRSLPKMAARNGWRPFSIIRRPKKSIFKC